MLLEMMPSYFAVRSRSHKALRYRTDLFIIKILICPYTDATVAALEIGKNSGLDTARLRELALRFNRNGTGESIVTMLFQSKCDEIFINKGLDESRK